MIFRRALFFAMWDFAGLVTFWGPVRWPQPKPFGAPVPVPFTVRFIRLKNRIEIFRSKF